MTVAESTSRELEKILITCDTSSDTGCLTIDYVSSIQSLRRKFLPSQKLHSFVSTFKRSKRSSLIGAYDLNVPASGTGMGKDPLEPAIFSR